MRKFCEHCLKEVNCTYGERQKELEYLNQKVKFLEKYYICNNCENEFYDDLYDYNIKAGNNELRKLSGTITIDEIKEITQKYNIGKKPLSLVLGLGEITITRYLDGQNPTKENSELLKNILNNPLLYEIYLEANKYKITKIAYKKSLGKTKQIEMNEDKSKIYNIALYLINKAKEIDSLSLQKILYFSLGFFSIFYKRKLANVEAESWKYGPVYKDVYECFSYYEYKKIDYNELLTNKELYLTKEEKSYLDTMLEFFGCYSGSILREMTHLTDPWLNTRTGLKEDESSNRIITIKDMDTYFEKIYKEYNMKSIKDIKKYSDDLFKEAQRNLFNRKNK